MKIKETKTCGAFAWSPTQKYAGLMAIGSVAGAMSDDFNSDALLEIRAVDVWDTNSTEMPVVGRIAIPDRVHRIDWSTHGGGRGILAGGFTDGTVSVWSADKIVEAGVAGEGAETAEEGAALLCKISAHSTATKGCHFNPLDQTLLATGGGDKEMKIWSLDRMENPKEVPAIGPNKSATHTGELTDLRWNPRFKHILGTTTSNGQVSCWDLKSKKVTMQFNVSPQGMQSAASTLAWHPDIATQVAVARDDPIPVIQVWDLRKAMAPIREMKGHTKGVLSLAWCAEDASVMMSTGADGRTMCWNPQTGDLFGEMPEQDNWVYDCKWAPHTPAVICTASFDNSLSVFGAQDISTGGSNGAAPKWLSRPCSASFGFGGRMSIADKSDKTGKTIRILKTPANPDSVAAKERLFCAEINKNPINSTEGVDWIIARGWGEIGAAAAARVSQSKTPLMKFLGADAEAVEKKVEDSCADGNYSLDETQFQETVAECVTAGKLVAAIDLCMVAGKFDDAFAIAYVTGDSQMKRVHAEFVAKKSGKHRYAKYLGAIASSDFEALIAEGDADSLPWREVLSLYAAFAPKDTFAAHCNKLGDALYAAGNLQPAVTCYVFGSNVDRVAQLQKESGDYDAQHLVQLLTVLEQSVGRQCTDEAFASALASYAETLAFDGEFQSAAHYAQRAATLGSRAAGLVAHRVQTHIGQQGGQQGQAAAFTVTPLPDATAMDCQMLAAKQQPFQQQQQQATSSNAAAAVAPATTNNAAARQQVGQQGQQAANSAQPRTAPHGGNAGPAQTQGQQPVATSGGHVDPRAQAPAGQNMGSVHHHPQGGGQQQPIPQQPPLQGGQQGQFVQPGGQPQTGGAVHTQQPPRMSPVQAHPQGTFSTGGTGGHQGGQPPVTNNMQQAQPPLVTAAPPVNNAGTQPPVQMQPEVQQGQQPAQVQQQPQPAQGAYTTPTVRHSPTMPTAGASMSMGSTTGGGGVGSAGQKETAAESDSSNVAADYQGIVQVVLARVEKITDKRRRDTTEKAAVALIKKLNTGDISPALGALLVSYTAALGQGQAAAAKEQWKLITEKHWDAIQPFHNIKFL